MNIRTNTISEEKMNSQSKDDITPSEFTYGDIEDLSELVREVPDFFPEVIDEISRSSDIEVIAYNWVNGLLVFDVKGSKEIVEELSTERVRLVRDDRYRINCRRSDE